MTRRQSAEEKAYKAAESIQRDLESVRNRISRIFQGRERMVDIHTSDAMRFTSMLSQIEMQICAAIIPASE